MKIRTQLVVAFLLLSVLPLTAIVLYSYYSSLEAVREAYEQEAAQMSNEMQGRMSSIREDIRERVTGIGRLPLEALASNDKSSDALRALVVERLGDAAPLIRSFEYVPEVPIPPKPPSDVGAQAGAGSAAPPAPHIPAAALHASHAMGHRMLEAQLPIIIDVEQILRDTREQTKSLDPVKQKQVLAQLERDLARVPKSVPSPPPPDDATTEEERALAAEEQRRDVLEATTAAVDDALENVSSEVETAEEMAADEEDEARRAEIQRSRERIEKLREKIRTRAAKLDIKQRKEMKLVFGRELEAPVMSDGSVVGKVKAQISGRDVLDRVLRSSRPQEGEIPFAVDREGVVYTVRAEDREKLQQFPLKDLAKAKAVDQTVVQGWVLATHRDAESDVTYGIARPIRRPLEEVKRTAARNFAYGIGLVALALFGIVPIANHMTRDVQAIAHGAERVAQGDLTTRVPVRSKNEFGHLAESFNRMARDLSEHQQRLVEQERHRREQEIQQRLLAAEYERKSQELEDARSFQLSLLPKSVPQLPGVSIDVFMRTAAEVGGDYYDFQVDENGVLTTVIGDATGHGARAATMVTVIKSLFAGYDSSVSPSRFLGDANETVKRMHLGRMAMGLALARLEGNTLTVAAAGMPPIFVRRKDGSVFEIELSGTPLGTLSANYAEKQLELEGGETILLMSDGFPELVNEAGEPFGYARVEEALRDAGHSPREVIAHLTGMAERWSATQNDDITFVALHRA